MTALLLAAAFACGAALPAMAEQATPETAAQPDPTEWADEAQDVTEAEEAPVYQQADAQEVATGETAASLTVTAADCTAQFIDEAYRLFLPVNTDMAALTIETGAELAAADAEGLTVDGTTVSGDFTNIETLNLTFTDGKAARVELYKSQLPSVSFTLNGVTLDEIQAGSKDVKYKGNSVTISQAGGSDLTDTDVEFKGRGNTTWTLDKRPYQFKLSSKAKVLGMDKAKTWLLIANRQDTSMMRNKAVYDLANAMGEWAPDGRWVDVWIDGSYQGCYLLCEKVQVGTNRVELEQEDGILAEADNIYYNGEEYWFTGNQSGTHFTLKDSAADDLDEQDSATLKAWSGFETALDEFEDVLYASDKDWNIISSKIDVQSFADYYLISEWVENWDTFKSSTFCYRDGADDVLHMGPVWDYDSALNNKDEGYGVSNPHADYAMNIQDQQRGEISLTWFTELMKCQQFREVVQERYQHTMRPLLENWSETCNDYRSTLENSAKMEFVRWDLKDQPGTARADESGTWQQDVDKLQDWIAQRTAYMTKRFDDEFVRRGNQADSMTLGGLNDNAVKLGAGQNKKYTFRLTPASACDTVRVTVDDPTVAKAEIGTYAGTFVVTGVQNGETTLTVRAGAASATVNVIIDDEARNGWYEENGKHYWYVDGERQGLQKGGLEFTDPDTGCRYWLDPDDSGARAENRKVQLDEDRLCYFDENGCMAFGEYLEHGGWYYYDEKTGAQCRGPVVLPDGRQVFYSLTNGKMLYGKQTICGTSFTFNTVNGSRSSGPDGLFWLEWGGKRYWFESWKRQGYNPYDSSYRGKEIYDPASDAWYWLDNIQNGAMAASKDVYQESNGGKWVRYDENGHMVKGWDVNENGTYYFDQITGAMAKGALLLDDVQYGFDPIMGTMLDCQWLHTEVGDYWYEGGIRQGTEGRGKEIYDLASDAWYWLDAVDNGKKAVSKDVYQESDGGKWVRYDADGHMIKGWDTQGVDHFYFDPITGAMAKGVVMIDGVRYWFDSRTGALIAPK
ncbi:MAG: CotH kinase family protein [Gemmiger qucibialis]